MYSLELNSEPSYQGFKAYWFLRYLLLSDDTS